MDDRHYCYIAYSIDAINEDSIPVLFCSINGTTKPISLSDLSALKSPIITYDFWWLVPAFRNKKLPLPAQVIDISQVAKLLIGRSNKEFNDELPWSIWKLLATFNNASDIKMPIKDIIYRRSMSDNIDIGYALTAINTWQTELWSVLLSQLKEKGEDKRYFEIELPIANILYKRQYQGIRVNERKLLLRLDALDVSINASARELRTRGGITDANDVSSIKKWLIKHNLPFIAENINKRSFDGLLEIATETSSIINLYHRYRKSVRDKKLLLRLGAIGHRRIFPVYDGLGTVTGRITIKSPVIQNLKSSSRDIFTPDKGFEFIYPDYCQFEPGILADDSNDMKLIHNYNSHDIYKALSVDLFGSDEYRKTAKKIFLSFWYGMEKGNIIKLLNEVSGNDVDYKNGIAKFFAEYSNIEEWRTMVQRELLETGNVCTRMGNCRYRKSKLKYLTKAEQRWAVSQRIQGTASLILKKTILDIDSHLKDNQFLIPMHDAVLYQFPNGTLSRNRKKIEEIFIDNFKSVCSKITPSISFESFYRPEQ